MKKKFYINIYGDIRSTEELTTKECRRLAIRNRLFETKEEARQIADKIENILTEKFLHTLHLNIHLQL